MSGSDEVDAYLAALPPERREALTRLRVTIAAAAPEAEEVITYRMPGFRLDGRFFVSYDTFKHHVSLFPATDGVIAALGPDIEPYLAGKGTIRFPSDQPIPEDLVRRVIEARLVEHRAPRSARRRDMGTTGA